MLGILQRYVIDQVFRAFLLALVTITSIFVLFMVMAEATRAGLAPQDIARIIPYIIPSSLPYTIPVALLFAASVVYGRMASDNEIVAIKTAGLSAVSALIPTWLIGGVLTAGLFYASSDAIPRSTNVFRKILFQDFEDMLYKLLKKEGQFDNANTPFYISVKDVEDHTLIGARFKHRKSKEDPNNYDFIIASERAKIRFDVPNGLVRIELENAETTNDSSRQFIFTVNGKQEIQYPLPKEQKYKIEKRMQEMTNAELDAEVKVLQKKIDQEGARQAVSAALWIGMGKIERVEWPSVGEAYREGPYWKKKTDEYRTEKQLRFALSAGSLCFVLLGAPVGILFARRDFLSAFATCFLPIMLLYYPLTLGFVNLAKEGVAWPAVVSSGNVLLAAIAAIVVIKVRKY